MCQIYGLKYSKYNVNKNKIEIKTLLILIGLSGCFGSNKVNPHGSCVFCIISGHIRTFGRKLQNVLPFRGQ
jgi:hypothetical protein